MKSPKKTIAVLIALVMVVAALPLYGFVALRASSVYDVEPVEIPLFGFTHWRHNGPFSTLSEVDDWLALSNLTPGRAAPIGSSSINFSAADIANDGFVYAYEDYVHDAEASVNGSRFYRVNTATWQNENLGRLPEDELVTDMAYDSDASTMYAVNLYEANYFLSSVDLSDGALTRIVNITQITSGEIPGGLAYLQDGWFLTVGTHTGRVVKFNLSGETQVLGTPLCHTLENSDTLTYSPVDNRVYAAVMYAHQELESRLYSFDPTTGEDLIDHGRIGGSLGYAMTSLFTTTEIDYTPLGGVPTDEEFNAALNVEGGQLNFHNDNINAWYIETADNRTYVQSGIQGQNSSTTAITADFRGLEAGQTLSFDWKVSSESNYDELGFYVNGVLQEEISGSTSWATKTYTVSTAGNYVFTWQYSKDSSVSNGNDCGYVDNVALTGDLPDPEPTPDPSEPTDPLSDALNVEGGAIQFFNSYTKPLVVVEKDGRTVAKTDIAHQDNTFAYVYIRGYFEAGTAIRFDWKASSAPNDDFFYFKRNNQRLQTISGLTEWETVTHVVEESGECIFVWSYEKTVETDGNEDCCWLDNVEIIPDYVPDPVPTIDPISSALFDEAANAEGENLHFENDSANPWLVDDTTDSDRISVRSNINGMINTESGFTTDLGYVGAGTTITFDWKTSSEMGWDRVCFTYNTYTMTSASGDTDWTTYTYTIENDGYALIGWKYEKNVNTDSGEDTVWVDNIIVQTVQPAPTTDIPVTNPPAPTTPAPLMGDANNDGIVNIGDAMTILRYLIHLIPESEINLALCDVNGDGAINTGDAAWLLSNIITRY